ncbi:hydroxyacylglutathione hydrolase [Psychromonas sp. CNPT3]|uniref:hydroxyacylglutathione hydrolase n=1 Tax=Psychromonas sp. CNPT3 TaxID=314282 RepID=UPI00006E9EA6|nr:hydroxyacylglutathione hydrolase [Psychromonas sp. CNPT3]AGH82157.1 hydroxyacylglutathione hydrolase [Psychromonas sp. CNPT3]
MLQVITIKAFNDNYIWLIKDSQSQRCILVDPGDAQPVLEILEQQNLSVDAILVTHAHQDHIGGISELLAHFNKEIPIYSKDKLFSSSEPVEEGKTLCFFEQRLSLKVMFVPGHTLDHVAYYNDSSLFCGDTLFSAGCGRVMEGTHQQMFTSLARISQLKDTTKVYCAHEYTQQNLIFALHLEPKNRALRAHMQKVAKLRQQGLASVPTTLALEKTLNPFLRCSDTGLKNALQNKLCDEIHDALHCFTKLRQYKDVFIC